MWNEESAFEWVAKKKDMPFTRPTKSNISPCKALQTGVEAATVRRTTFHTNPQLRAIKFGFTKTSHQSNFVVLLLFPFYVWITIKKQFWESRIGYDNLNCETQWNSTTWWIWHLSKYSVAKRCATTRTKTFPSQYTESSAACLQCTVRSAVVCRGCCGAFQAESSINGILGYSPFPVIVTTRIITCLVGDSYKPSFATISGKGGQSKWYPSELRLFSGFKFDPWGTFKERPQTCTSKKLILDVKTSKNPTM